MTDSSETQSQARIVGPCYPNAKPYTRWWWFSGSIRQEDIRFQLNWLKANGFGGVEIAWVYPLPGSEPGPEWLSPEWSRIVAYAKQYAQSIGLGCDFTFGSAWPFGGSIVEEKDAARTFQGLSPQRLMKSWEAPPGEPGYILNHLDRSALEHYSEKMGSALAPALSGSPSALFCDSWEVEPEGLWTEGFGEVFQKRYGYDLGPFLPALNEHPDVRYDYRKLLSEYVLQGFYRPFTEICHGLGAFSRVQSHGAPTDLLSAYAAADVPESEAVLFDPAFSQIAASAAALSGKLVVSAEAFTCLYGWKPWPGPGDFQGKEQTADLKLVADALFANGVNFILWHGMPYQPQGCVNRFYASVHVGPDSAFAEELPAFNAYLERVSGEMRWGKTYADLAVYLPLEDAWMRHELPHEKRRPSARYHWELQHERSPADAVPYRPLWVTSAFLERAEFREGVLRHGEAEFQALYVHSEWLDGEALAEIRRLAEQGLPVCFRKRPSQPGRVKIPSFEKSLRRLLALPNCHSNLTEALKHPPLLEGGDLPECWCRMDGEEALLFCAHPLSKTVGYPLRYGQSRCSDTFTLPVAVHWKGKKIPLALRFEPYQSLLVRISREGTPKFEDIAFRPRDPVMEFR